jgi:PhnB protein
VALHVCVPDVDALTARAVAAGGELLSPATDMTYGARQSMLRDPFGHVWIFLTPVAV